VSRLAFCSPFLRAHRRDAGVAEWFPEREMLPLPALTPGIFTCSSFSIWRAPFLTTQGKRTARMGRPRAGTASNCVIIVRLDLGGVNGTNGLGPSSARIRQTWDDVPTLTDREWAIPNCRLTEKHGPPTLISISYAKRRRLRLPSRIELLRFSLLVLSGYCRD